jgi:hypothetical protein
MIYSIPESSSGKHRNMAIYHVRALVIMPWNISKTIHNGRVGKLMPDKYYWVGTGLSIKELRGPGLFLQVRRSVGADSVMCYNGLVKMLDPANLNSVFTLFRSGCFTNGSQGMFIWTLFGTLNVPTQLWVSRDLDKQGNVITL